MPHAPIERISRPRVAWLGGFWVLTLFPQIFVHIYFLVGQNFFRDWYIMPIEYVLSGIYLGIACLQLLIGYSTIKRLVAKAMADFHLQPVDDLDDAQMTI